MPQIELRIEGSVEEGWTAQWSLDGVAAGAEIRIGAVDAARLATEGRRFLALFEQGVRPLVEPAVLSSLGAELARIWLDPARKTLGTALGSEGGEIVIAGHDARALDLPWELIELHPGLPVGCDAAWALRREVIADGAARSDVPLPPPGGGPLRILFLASSPEDQPPLDLEREEDLVLRPTEGLRGEVIVHIAEVGTFDELRRLVGRVKPQVVHLSGHGDLNSNGEGVFAFETEEGGTDLRTAEQIAEAVARGASVRLFVLNACKSSQAGTAGLCRALAAAGVPNALGWAASVEDGVGTRFVTTLYRDLMSGAPVGRAVANARRELREQGKIDTNEGPKLDASFALSQLYGRGRGELIDLGKPSEVYDGPSTEYALLGDGVKGLKEGFIGRRRDVWRVLRAMRRGEPTVAMIWGIGGAGKSTLATRVANRLHEDGFHILPVRAPDGDDPAAIGRETRSKVVGAIERAFQKAGREDLIGTFRSEKIAPEQRLRLAVEGLCEIRALLVLDNLEGALALETRRIVDPGLAFLLKLLATDLTRGSRLLITCRYEIADPASLGALGLEVKDFRSSDVRKFFRRDERVEERLHRGEIPLWLFDRLATESGGTPRFLETARTVLRTADPEDLLADLDGVDPGPITEKRREYLEKILVQRLYEALSPEARSIASRLAVSELPLPGGGVARIAGCGEEEAILNLREGVTYGLLQIFEEVDLPTLYHPPSLLRPWLAEAGLGEEESREVHAELAHFWRERLEDSEQELLVPAETQLMTCRVHAAAGGEREVFGWATVRLVSILDSRSEWLAARAFLEELPETERSADVWHQLGSIDAREGLLGDAREKLVKSLAISKIDRTGEAATWHQLGMIDLEEASYSEARENFGRSLAFERSIGNRSGEATTLSSLGSIDLKEGSYGQAREKLGQALEIFRSVGNRSGEAATWHQLGVIDVMEGSYVEARKKLGETLAIQQMIGDRSGEALAQANLGTIDLNEGSYGEAREKLGKALAIRQAIGDRLREGSTWHQLGSIDMEEGSYESARESLRRSLLLEQEIGDLAGEASTWHQLSSIDVEMGLYGEAREKAGKALAIQQAIGDRSGEALTWHQLGSIDEEVGLYREARVKLGRALVIQRAIGNRSGEAATLARLGSIDTNEGLYGEAREKLDSALATQQAIGDRSRVAAILAGLGSIDLNEGSYVEAREKLGRALAIQQAIGDRSGEASTLESLGSIDLSEGSNAGAREKLDKALAIHQAIGERSGEASALAILGSIDLKEGSYAKARELLGRALAIRQTIGDLPGEASTWHQLGVIDVEEGSYGEAREKLSQALVIRQTIGNRSGEATTLAALGTIYISEGLYGKAREELGRALAIRQTIGDLPGEASAWHQLGVIDVEEGSYGEAREKLSQALVIRQTIGNRSGEATTLAALGTIYISEGLYGKAREELGKASAILKSIGDHSGEASTWHLLGTIAAEEGSHGEARQSLGKALVIRQTIGNRSGEAATLANLGAIDLKEGSLVEAREKLGKALAILKSTGDRPGEGSTWHLLGTVDVVEGSYEEAREKLGKALTIRQTIGNRSGEAATWAQLGVISYRMGRAEASCRLTAVALCILSAIGAVDAKIAAGNLKVVWRKLGHDEAELRTLLADVQAEYECDRGKALLERAFADFPIDAFSSPGRPKHPWWKFWA